MVLVNFAKIVQADKPSTLRDMTYYFINLQDRDMIYCGAIVPNILICLEL